MVNIIELHIITEGIKTEFQCDLCLELKVNEFKDYFFEKSTSASNIK